MSAVILRSFQHREFLGYNVRPRIIGPYVITNPQTRLSTTTKSPPIFLSTQQWREILDRFFRSGLSQEQYCAQEGLILSTFLAGEENCRARRHCRASQTLLRAY